MVECASSFALLNVGSSNAARIAMIAITTSSSIKVNANATSAVKPGFGQRTSARLPASFLFMASSNNNPIRWIRRWFARDSPNGRPHWLRARDFQHEICALPSSPVQAGGWAASMFGQKQTCEQNNGEYRTTITPAISLPTLLRQNPHPESEKPALPV